MSPGAGYVYPEKGGTFYLAQSCHLFPKPGACRCGSAQGRLFFFFNSSTQREHYFLIHAKVLFRFVGDPRCSPPHASIPVESCPKQAGRQACLRQPGKWEKRLEETEAIPCPAFVVKNPGKGAGEGKNTEKKPERHN